MTSFSVSVIMPTYNRANYIEESLQSLLSQVLPVNEIIIVNDGSTDETQDILKKYQYHEFIQVINKKNGGRASAINEGIKLAKSDYVWICDDDDIANKNAMTYFQEAYIKDTNAGFIFGKLKIFVIDDYGNKQISDYKFFKRPEEPNYTICFLENMFAPQYAMVFKTELLKKLGGHDESFLRAQDYEMMVRILESSHGIFTDNVIFYYRLHDGPRGSVTEKITSENKQEKWFEYEQKIFLKHNVADYSLDIFTPTFALEYEKKQLIRASYIQKGLIFANKGMWGYANEYFEKALSASDAPMSQKELNLAKSVVQGKIRWQSLSKNKKEIARLRNLAKYSKGKDFLSSFTRPILWICKNELEKDSIAAVKIASLFFRINGIISAFKIILK